MKIYTYHEYVPELPTANGLLPIWEESWRKNGWEPVILDRSHAEQHPNYKEFLEKYKSLPTVNASGYELACYLRWLAMAVVGGGWMSDSDVMSYGFRPHAAPENMTIWSHGGSICPCLVSGSSEQYTHAASVFAAWQGQTNLENGQPHASDQNILCRVDHFYDNIPLCSQYGESGWQFFPLVHYSNGTMVDKQPREEHIPLLKTL